MSAVGPYQTGAPAYQAAGWTGIIPLPPKKKGNPPSGYTGWNGRDPSAKMIETWCNETKGEFQAASNIGIRMPYDMVGIDVDHYGEKTGGDTLAQLEKDLGPLPTTYTSRGAHDKVSAIRWFRIDTDEPLKWPTGPGKDIEFIHFGHRYAVVWPSIHPDTGDTYLWFDHDGMPCLPPEPDACAELPVEWVIRFTGGEIADGNDPVDPPTQEQIDQCMTGGDICQATTKGIRKYLEESTTTKSHHDAMRDSILYLVRLGEQGLRGVDKGVDAVRRLFEQYAQGRDKYEVDRAIDGAVARVLAKPTPEHEKRCCGSQANRDDVATLTKNLPEEFWASRPVLGHIRQAAHSRGRSADVVLYATLARISAMASPLLRFENCLGEGSLNLFVAPIGKSGRGKSAAVKIAKTLIRTPRSLANPELFRDSIGIGSGEGLAELYMGWVYVDDYSRAPKKNGDLYKKRVKEKVRDNAFVYVDEGQTLSQQGKRQGNIVLPTIRSAFNGETLGQANASEETSRHVPAGSYSLGMVIGYQMDTAQELLADVAPGSPAVHHVLSYRLDRSLSPARAPRAPGSGSRCRHGQPFRTDHVLPRDQRGTMAAEPRQSHRGRRGRRRTGLT
jgi:hypothetical protein